MIRSATDTVVKVGGSLLAGGKVVPLLRTLGALAGEGHRVLVVPGGGPFADAVRRAAVDHAPGDSAAHWMAVLAMDQLGLLLHGIMAADGHAAALVRSPRGVVRAHEKRVLPILAPFRWLRAADPLPHGWDVTADSLAAWIASRTGARRLVLLKSVDVVPERMERVPCGAGPRALPHELVDAYFLRALTPGTECWILNGRNPDRLQTLLERGTAPGTRVC